MFGLITLITYIDSPNYLQGPKQLHYLALSIQASQADFTSYSVILYIIITRIANDNKIIIFK